MGDLWFYESISVFRINPTGSITFLKPSFAQQVAGCSTWNIVCGSIKSLAHGLISLLPKYYSCLLPVLHGRFSLNELNTSYMVYPPKGLLDATPGNGRVFHVEHWVQAFCLWVWGILLIRNGFHHPALPAGSRDDSLRTSISAPILSGFTNIWLEGRCLILSEWRHELCIGAVL